MNLTRRSLLALGGLGAATLAACDRSRSQESEPEPAKPDPEPIEPKEDEPEEPQVDLKEFEDLALDMDAWQYDEIGNCYYQLGLPYCLNSCSEQYETLSIFVPGTYFTAEKHGKRMTCEIAEDGVAGEFLVSEAPFALPVNVRSFGAQECPTTYAYEGIDRYLEAGIIYVYPGLRGRNSGYESTTQEYYSGGAPWPVADLKAVVRWLRYNAAVLPGDTARIFAFGMGSGGELVSALGTSGNAEAFAPYLASLGAATHDVQGNDLSDDIAGVAAWCPLTALDAADAAYEWMMGQYASEGARAEGTWTDALSDDLADEFGSYVNDLGLVDADGESLTLDRIEDGTYGGGSYYEHLIDIVEDAALSFFKRTKFPYTEVPATEVARQFPGNPSLDSLGTGDATLEDGDEGNVQASGVRQVQATVYETLESYVSSLNGEDRWLTYNASRGSVDVTGLWDFAANCRPATDKFCAYDVMDRSGFVNQLFGTDDLSSVHFDALVARLVEEHSKRYAKLDGWDEELVAACRGDLAETDTMDLTVADRVAMINPLHYLLAADGEDPVDATVAPHWRINTGLFQSKTTLVGEVNLVCALAAHESVADVAFEPVWGAGFTLAERKGDAEDNLISWISSCCPEAERAGDAEDAKDEADEPADEADEPADEAE